MSKSKDALGKIRDLPDDELGQAADQARDELFRLKLQSYTNQVQDTASIRNKRRELARILTISAGRARGTEVQAAQASTGAEPAAEPETAKAKKSTTKKEG
jgi:large subunit ribosomal protein L29